MKITEDELWKIIYHKLDPIIEKVTEEFEKTEEYQAIQEQKRIIDKYQRAKEKFESKYGYDTYKYCYDVFGNLRIKEYLKKLKFSYESQQQYKSRYQEHGHSNFNWNNFSSYQGISQSNYTSEEKELAQEIISLGHKQLAKRLHPDVGGTKESFQQLGFKRKNV